MKKLFFCLALGTLSLLFTGCAPRTHSMGYTLMPSPLQHRVNPDSVNNNIDVSASGFWGFTDEDENIKSVKAGGGNVSATYRFNKSSAFFFANVAAGGFGGSAKFSCDENDDCDEFSKKLESKNYWEWLNSNDGHKVYSFGVAQERVSLGGEINNNELILGFAEGVQFYQTGGSYERTRERLMDMGYARRKDSEGRLDWANVSMLWLGTYLGKSGRLGNVVIEFDILHGRGGFFDDGWTHSTKYTYTHPSGFFVGAAEGSLVSWLFYAGKQFSF